MSLSEILIKVGGVVLFVVGICLILAAVGVATFIGVGAFPAWMEIIAGIAMIWGGIVIVRGGSPTL